MTLPVEISPKEIAVASAAIAVTAYCAYKIWLGRKVTPTVPWKDDDDNPANWYLKYPNKFLGKT